MEYSVLVIPDNTHRLSAQLLKRLHKLVEGGLTLISPRPAGFPSLDDEGISDSEYRSMVSDLWGTEANGTAEHKYGKGSVIQDED